jgi:hypothetical protein
MVVIYRGSRSETFQVGTGFSWISIDRKVKGGEGIIENDNDIGKCLIISNRLMY